jgi:thiamine-phosphate pyrophosphorylase
VFDPVPPVFDFNPTESRSLYRILDANLNRCREGLRMLEDIARFVLDDDTMCEGWKKLRHRLHTIAQRWSRAQLLAARDTEQDVGCSIKTPQEAHRTGYVDLVGAAASRSQESLRCLSELAKMFDPEAAADLEALRYACYTLAASQESRLDRRRQLANARLYVLVECGTSENQFVEHIARLFEAGVDMIQLRDKQASDDLLYQRGELAARAATKANRILIINDRADIAVAADAHGVHVGQSELPAGAARRVIGGERLLGVSTHRLQQAKQAISDGADYIGCGPTFVSTTKQFQAYAGLAYLQEVANCSIPTFAIGGITSDNMAEVLATGVHGVALAGALTATEHPYDLVRQLREMLHAHAKSE